LKMLTRRCPKKVHLMEGSGQIFSLLPMFCACEHIHLIAVICFYFILLYIFLLADVTFFFANLHTPLSEVAYWLLYINCFLRFFIAQLATQGKLLSWGAKVRLQLIIWSEHIC
jgi:hypothetical protein